MNQLLFADDKVLVADRKRKLRRLVEELVGFVGEGNQR